MELLQGIVQHPIFGITSFVLAVFGVLLSCLFYAWGRRAKRPFWAIKSTSLIRDFSGSFPRLEITYGEKKIENLTVSTVVFWNGGAETIHSSDIAEADLLRITPTNTKRLLDVKVLKVNSEPSRFAVSTPVDMTVAYLQFDFLDRDCGARIQFIHTGTSSNDLVLAGTIKGAGAPKKQGVEAFKPRKESIREAVLGGVGALVFLPYVAVRSFQHFTGKDNVDLFGIIIVLVPPLIIGAFALKFMLMPFVRNRCPRGLAVEGD